MGRVAVAGVSTGTESRALSMLNKYFPTQRISIPQLNLALRDTQAHSTIAAVLTLTEYSVESVL